jgi:hypothetical protein
LLGYDAAAIAFGGNLAYRDDFLARSDFVRGDVQLYRCAGPPIVLHAAGRSGECGGEPWDIDLRGGVLSWDTGCAETDAGGTVESFPGRIYTYSLVHGTRESWAIPRLHTFTVLDGGPRNAPQRGPRCSCGASSDTADTVFWIATHTFGCGEKFCDVATVDVYAARRREDPWS